MNGSNRVYKTCSEGSQTILYDAAGNLTNDHGVTYAWDAEGHMAAVDSTTLTYDALGRMVEQNRSGSYTQIVYEPLGAKLALMSGGTLSKAFVALPGGATAVYAGTSLSYYRHADWLGSSRFASTPTRTLRYDGAYAPYGENYAETGTTDRSFTGQNQDTISSGSYPLYDFMFREYHAVHSRWLSPDPLAGSILNPQSLPERAGIFDNRYAYVLNNPTNLVDPSGGYSFSSCLACVHACFYVSVERLRYRIRLCLVFYRWWWWAACFYDALWRFANNVGFCSAYFVYCVTEPSTRPAPCPPPPF